MNTFEINGKRYNAPKFNYNAICALEEAGVPIQDMKKKPAATARAYFSLCFDGDKDQAGAEIEAHMIAGGSLESLMTAMAKEIDESDFFRAINKSTATTQTAKRKTAKVEEN
ncbi:MAG: hypothetical protein IJ680_05850 [Paludibacteraceae bacterium]|nr:hypothetical protein [Paludibacteraceae bacterium]